MTVVIPENVDKPVAFKFLTIISGVPVKPAAVPVVFWFSAGILSALKVPVVILVADRLGI